MTIPSVVYQAASHAFAKDPFASLLKFEPAVGQEIRAEDNAGGERYHGRAVDGTPTSTAAWEIVRFYRNASGDIERVRYAVDVAWDDRASSATWP